MHNSKSMRSLVAFCSLFSLKLLVLLVIMFEMFLFAMGLIPSNRVVGVCYVLSMFVLVACCNNRILVPAFD